MRFPQPPKDLYATVYLEDTDRPLPAKIDVRTRYAFFKTIARGGKSIIQSCKDLHLSRVVCHKSLRPELAEEPLEQQRFLREARVTAMLQHPNTVPVYELGRDGHGRCYFTMKLVHGYTLREILDYRERYDLNQLVGVIVQTLRALDFAHTLGVVHRDIKPENILVGPFGEVLVLDWGLAKVWNHEGVSPEPPAEAEADLPERELSLTGQGKLQGTVAYMSPEQIRRDPGIDHRTDIYSVGAVLFETLCGRVPAEGETVDEVIDAVLRREPAKPREIAEYHVPRRLEELCLLCLRKEADRRIPTAAQLIRELQEDWRG